MSVTRRHLLAGAAGLGAAPLAARAQGFDLEAARRRLAALKPQGYPSQPIEMVVVYPAGGGMDITARVVQRFFERVTGERSFVNNRTGGAGLVGHTWLATQAPGDGHALGIVANLIFADARRSQGRWKWDDLDHIAALNAEPLNLVVNAEGAFKDSGFRGAVEAARARPNTVRFTVVPGGYYEWMIDQIEQASGARFLKVPFQGGGPGVTALLGNNVDIALGFFGEIRSHIQANRLVPVAVAGRERSPFLPNTPTVNEVLNVQDIVWGVSRWVAVPRAVPAPRKAWLAAAFHAAVQDPELIEEFRNLGALPDPSLDTPEKVLANIAAMARAEEEFLIRTGRLQR
ncbi:MAG TPA: tripartite tricarboxylate transporter substrate binding protein [Acetobacteraceae bacterium]|nr:tripartite tricarboxylate transporter substrate binding protein [Acetobacteraceae bacterium]